MCVCVCVCADADMLLHNRHWLAHWRHMLWISLSASECMFWAILDKFNDCLFRFCLLEFVFGTCLWSIYKKIKDTPPSFLFVFIQPKCIYWKIFPHPITPRTPFFGWSFSFYLLRTAGIVSLILWPSTWILWQVKLGGKVQVWSGCSWVPSALLFCAKFLT